MRAGNDPPFRGQEETAAVTRSAVLKQLGVAAAAGVVAAGAGFGGPLPALADNALAGTKRSYFRYVPRILVSERKGGRGCADARARILGPDGERTAVDPF